MLTRLRSHVLRWNPASVQISLTLLSSSVAAASGLTAAPSPLIGSNFRVGSFPAIATDPTDASFVYITWSSDNGPSQTDVFVTHSLNAGTTWSAPVRVNDDPPGNPRDQFFPWIAVDTDGTVRVMWGDDRLDLLNPGGKFYDIFMAESVDHGASFGPNIRHDGIIKSRLRRIQWQIYR
jgi:hypothetical protein